MAERAVNEAFEWGAGEREGWNARGKGGVECPGKGKGEMLREREGRNGR